MFKWLTRLVHREPTVIKRSKPGVPKPSTAPVTVEPEVQPLVLKPVAEKVDGHAALRAKLNTMTKLEIDVYARNTYNIMLDRRRTKAHMIADLIKLINTK